MAFAPGVVRVKQCSVHSAQQHVQDGYRIVFDVDLEKFFDRVNHDVLMSRLQRHVQDAGVLRLLRAFLNAGIMHHGVVGAAG